MAMSEKKILIVAATSLEVQPMLVLAGIVDPLPGKLVSLLQADLLITGPGIAATAVQTAVALVNRQYSYVLNAGVAGSFNPDLEPGNMCLVTRDRFADFGTESPEGLIPGELFPYTRLNQPPFRKGWLEPHIPATLSDFNLPHLTAITSDTVHTNPASIQRLNDLWNPDLESMEGAALFYTCMMMGVPCAQIRSVSNRVGPRGANTWHLETAVDTLNRFLQNRIINYG
jgi:futalosine hydrolase